MDLQAKRAFLIDLDGTLVDSRSHHERSFHKMLAELAPELVAAFDYRRVQGRSTRGALEELLGAGDPERLARMIARKQALYRELVAAGAVRLFPGARELLAHLAPRRRAILVTSAGRSSAAAVLERFGLGELLAGMVTGDDVTHAKPDPEIVELALARLDVPAAGALTVEDSASGVAASLAAGVEAVLVNGEVPDRSRSSTDSSRSRSLARGVPGTATVPGVLRFPTLAEFARRVIDEVR